MIRHALLLTGASGVGKSTVVRRVADALEGRSFGGFWSGEVREGRKRVGFRLEAFGGERALLAHVDSDSPHRLGRYGVEVEALDRLVEMALAPGPGLYLVDEIGPMECFSERFVAAVRALLDSGARIVATIHRNAGGFVQEVKERPDTELWEVTRENRDAMAERVLAWI